MDQDRIGYVMMAYEEPVNPVSVSVGKNVGPPVILCPLKALNLEMSPCGKTSLQFSREINMCVFLN